MRTFTRVVFGMLAVAAIAATAYFGPSLVREWFAPKAAADIERTVAVRVDEVKRGEIREVRTFNGNVEPLYEVDLTPQIQGRLVSLTLKRGEEEITVTENLRVKAGEVIATLDYAGLEAEMNKAEADYQKAMRSEEEEEREKNRWERLFKEGSATEKQRDDAVSAHKIAVEETKSQKASVESKRWDYEQAFLKAPFDGVISRVYADVGATVGPGMPVARLVHLDVVRVFAYVPSEYIGAGRIGPGSDVTIAFEGDAGTRAAKVLKVYEEAERATRATMIECRVNNEVRTNGPGADDATYAIRGNMYARVSFVVRNKPDAIRIPADAVVRIGNKDYVFTVNDNSAKKKGVLLGIWEGAYVEVLEGLNEGESLVVGGQTRLADGTKVAVSGRGFLSQPVAED